MNASMVARSLMLFALAGLAEISGGYLVWRALRNGGGIYLAIAGALLLILYGILPTFQLTSFGRTYAAYGGFFVVLSLLWGWWIDRVRPDTPDVAGALLCPGGVAVIMYWPRS